jgi:hypothetical protein
VYIGSVSSHPLDLYAGNGQRVRISSAGNVIINAPSSGTTLTVNGVASGNTIIATASELPQISVDTTSVGVSLRAWEAGARGLFGTLTNHPMHVRTNDIDRLVIAGAGNVTVNAPSSGVALTVNGIANQSFALFTDNTRSFDIGSDTSNNTVYIGSVSSHPLDLYAGNGQRVRISSAGNVVINAPSSGDTITAAVNSASSAFVAIYASGGGYGFLQSVSSGNTSGIRLGQTGVVNWDIENFASSGSFRISDGTRVPLSINLSGNITIAAPSSGTTLAITGAAGGNTVVMTVAGNDTIAVLSSTGGSGRDYALRSNNSTGTFVLRDNTASADRITVGSTGSVTIAAPTSGAALTVNGTTVVTNNGGSSFIQSFDGSGFYTDCTGAFTSHRIYTNGVLRVTIASAGNVTIAGAVATPPVAVTFSPTAMTVDCRLSNVFTTTFTANVTTAPTLSNPQDGQTINWFITQDATGGRTMTWPSTFRWPGGLAGILSTAANAVDLMVATYRSSTGLWYASLSKGFA